MHTQKPLVSIIMPCFNHGAYIMEALDTVRQQSYRHYEVIIVNDGSTDTATLEILSNLSAEVTVIHQQNAGPSVARHNGIQQARGKYLFFLDSDNKVRDGYISQGVQVMEANHKVGVVYSDGLTFGAGEARKVSGEFDVAAIIFANPIDLCSVVRRETYDATGGFDTYLSRLGLEDWDFWFGVYESGWQFHYIPEILYEYRVLEASRTQLVANKNLDRIISHIYQKHAALVYLHYQQLYYENRQLKGSIDKHIGGAILTPYRVVKKLFK